MGLSDPELESFIDELDDVLLMKPQKPKYKEILEQIWAFSEEERGEFFQEFSKSSIARDVWFFLMCLPAEEFRRFARQYEKTYGKNIRAEMVRTIATQIQEENPEIEIDLDYLTEVTEAKMYATAHRRSKVSLAHAKDAVAKQRNRQSDPDIVVRNINICDQLTEGMSQGQVAKKHGISDAMVRKIKKKESKWRLKYRQLQQDKE
jgi:hypothetical protein